MVHFFVPFQDGMGCHLNPSSNHYLPQRTVHAEGVDLFAHIIHNSDTLSFPHSFLSWLVSSITQHPASLYWFLKKILPSYSSNTVMAHVQTLIAVVYSHSTTANCLNRKAGPILLLLCKLDFWSLIKYCTDITNVSDLQTLFGFRVHPRVLYPTCDHSVRRDYRSSETNSAHLTLQQRECLALYHSGSEAKVSQM